MKNPKEQAAPQPTPLSKFQVGDVVMLKSGGPEMTVFHVDAQQRIFCMWFRDDRRDQTDFWEPMIEKVDRPNGEASGLIRLGIIAEGAASWEGDDDLTLTQWAADEIERLRDFIKDKLGPEGELP